VNAAAAVAVAETPRSPAPSCRSSSLDLDVAARIEPHACLIEAEVVGVGPAAGCDQHVRAASHGCVVVAARSHLDLRTVAVQIAAQCNALGRKLNLDAFALEDGLQRNGNVGILARPPVAPRAASTVTREPKRLNIWAELEPDVAAADHDQVFGQGLPAAGSTIRQHRNLVDAFERRPVRPRRRS